MNRTEQIKEILEEMGLSPVVNGNSIEVTFEMKFLVINTTENEPNADEDEDKYINIQLNRLYDIQDESEITEILVICNKLNRELRQIKTYISEDLSAVDSSFEFWFLDDADLRNNISTALYMFSYIRTYFYQSLREIRAGSDTPEITDNNDVEEKSE